MRLIVPRFALAATIVASVGCRGESSPAASGDSGQARNMNGARAVAIALKSVADQPASRFSLGYEAVGVTADSTGYLVQLSPRPDGRTFVASDGRRYERANVDGGITVHVDNEGQARALPRE